MEKIVAGFMFLLLGVTLACSSKKNNNPENRSATATQTASDLPSITLINLDGNKFTAKSLQGHPIILVLYQASCDHCQREAKQIKEHIDAFRDYHLYFISADAPAEASKFADEYKLAGESNVTFSITDVPSVLNSFGAISTPSVYIYDAEGKLMTKFNGETDINLILKKL